MDAKKLRYFVTVAQLGSFAAAARMLHIAQPALSRHVNALEQSLGVMLLKRDARGVRPTEEGELLLVHALDALERLEMLPRLVGNRSDQVAGRVVIGLPTSASAVLSTAMLREALERFPLVRIHLIETLSGYLEEWIDAGRLDLAILFDARATPGIRLDPLVVEDLWLVGGPASLPASLSDIPLGELPGFRLVVPSASHSNRRLVEGIALSHNLRLDVVAEVDSLSIQKDLVADGKLFTILAHSAIHAELAAGTLRAARIVSPTISRSVALASVSARSKNPACNAIAQLILDLSRRLVNAQVWRGRPAFSPEGSASHVSEGLAARPNQHSG